MTPGEAVPSNLPKGTPVSQQYAAEIVSVDSFSEFGDVPSDRVCKLESVKPFIHCV